MGEAEAEDEESTLYILHAPDFLVDFQMSGKDGSHLVELTLVCTNRAAGYCGVSPCHDRRYMCMDGKGMDEYDTG